MFCFALSSVGIPCSLSVVSFTLFDFRANGSTLDYWIDAGVSLSTGKGRNPPGDQKEETGQAAAIEKRELSSTHSGLLRNFEDLLISQG
jgi:hypothetical protein